MASQSAFAAHGTANLSSHRCAGIKQTAKAMSNVPAVRWSAPALSLDATESIGARMDADALVHDRGHAALCREFSRAET